MTGPPHEGRLIIGEIRTELDHAKPFIRVLSRDEAAAREAQFGRCEHNSFLLDERARRVECGECHETIDAFAVLARWAAWDAEMRQLIARKDYAAAREYRALCAQLAGRRHVTEGERAELRSAHTKWNATAEELEQLYRRVADAERARRSDARKLVRGA